MSDTTDGEVNVLQLTLHGRKVGYLAGFRNGRNVLSFAEEFRGDASRPTFSLITHPRFSNSERLLRENPFHKTAMSP